MKVRSIENCAGDDPVIWIDPNSTAIITKNCKIKTRGCTKMRDFKWATGIYSLFRNNVQVLRSGFNLCDKLKQVQTQPDAFDALETFNVPNSCPIEEQQICSDPSQVITINQRNRRIFNIARGKLRAEVEINHDSGKSCFKLNFDILPRNRK